MMDEVEYFLCTEDVYLRFVLAELKFPGEENNGRSEEKEEDRRRRRR